MIGQNHIKRCIDIQVANDDFPRFSIIAGEKGSGKKELVKYIAQKLGNVQIYPADIKVESVRKVISDAYTISGIPVLYVFYDADRMSVSAKNALLKLTEEPPNNAYIIMTLTDLDSTLDTIRSRASIYMMTPYTYSELMQYTVENYPQADLKMLLSVCTNPGEINELIGLCKGNVQEFFDYVNLVLDNLASVSIANAFKSVGRIALKDTDTDKFDLKIFWQGIISVIMLRITTDSKVDLDELHKWGGVVEFTQECLSTLAKVPAINKATMLDVWIIKFRAEAEARGII
mgnify:CR=1 FL=1